MSFTFIRNMLVNAAKLHSNCLLLLVSLRIRYLLAISWFQLPFPTCVLKSPNGIIKSCFGKNFNTILSVSNNIFRLWLSWSHTHLLTTSCKVCFVICIYEIHLVIWMLYHQCLDKLHSLLYQLFHFCISYFLKIFIIPFAIS